jgi:HD-like signal output (HDOD) protein
VDSTHDLGGTADEEFVGSVSFKGEAGLRDDLLREADDLQLGNPETFWRIASLCRDPRVDARDVALEIQRDEGFATSVLRLANSAYYASSNRVGDLAAAVARLGFSMVEGLALSAQGARLVGGARDGLAPFRLELHRHAVRTGLAARMISSTADDGEQALAAGLVHNLGLSVIGALRPHIFAVLVETAQGGEQLRQVEEDRLQFTHAELGGLLAERWRYPLPLVMAIVDHDDGDAVGLPAVIQVADRLAREAGVGVEAPIEITDDLMSRAGIDLEKARERVAPLFQAQQRAEGAAVSTSAEGRFAAALDECGV